MAGAITNARKILLMAVFAIPLDSSQNWQVLSYSRITPNKVTFNDVGMTLDVNASASPIVYPLTSKTEVKQVRIKGTVSSLLSLPPKAVQGQKGADDFAVRIGFVLPGERTLNFFQKAVAASWVKKLFSLAPKGAGIDNILFLNAAQQPDLVGKSRVHPLSDLISERFIWKLNKVGEFELEHKLEKPIETVALWISSDGDDTKSKYTLHFNSIELINDK